MDLHTAVSTPALTPPAEPTLPAAEPTFDGRRPYKYISLPYGEYDMLDQDGVHMYVHKPVTLKTCSCWGSNSFDVSTSFSARIAEIEERLSSYDRQTFPVLEYKPKPVLERSVTFKDISEASEYLDKLNFTKKCNDGPIQSDEEKYF